MSAARKALEALEKFPGSDCKHAKANEACDCAVDTVADLAAPLAAVVRAAMEYRDAWAAFVAFRGAETHRVLLLRRAAQFAALDAFNAAALAQGFAP